MPRKGANKYKITNDRRGLPSNNIHSCHYNFINKIFYFISYLMEFYFVGTKALLIEVVCEGCSLFICSTIKYKTFLLKKYILKTWGKNINIINMRPKAEAIKRGEEREASGRDVVTTTSFIKYHYYKLYER